MITAPAWYWSWLSFVVLALVGSYFADPYIFGFATLFLASLSAAVSLVGIILILAARSLARSARLNIALSIGINAAVIVLALCILHGFKWA